MPFLLPDQEPFRHKKIKKQEKQGKTGKNREKHLNNKIQQKMIKKVKRKKEMWGK